jgi:hypothetical protein
MAFGATDCHGSGSGSRSRPRAHAPDTIGRVGRKVEGSASLQLQAVFSAGIKVMMSTRLMLHWAEVAIEQERLALAARTRLEQARAAGEPLEFSREMHPAMIAIAAAAHSLEALYRELAGLVQPESVEGWEARRKHGMWAQVQGALVLAFEIEPERWRHEVATLFRLRNAAVHPRVALRESEPHPLGVNTVREYVLYSAEEAERAVSLLLEVLTTCVAAPREPLKAWAADARGPVAELVNRRGQGQAR